MNDCDKSRFRDALTGAAAIYGTETTPAMMAGYWGVLAPRITIEQCEAAIVAHMADRDRGQRFPRPADLMPDQRNDGRPEKNEAWAMVLVSMDEGATVVLTQDMQEARCAALPSWEDGDHVGARMAFLAAYERVVSEARSRGESVRWFASLGHDIARREPPLQDAVRRGRLARDQVAGLLPAPAPAADSVPAAVAGLLTGNVVRFPVGAPDAAARRRLDALKAAIDAGQRATAAREAAVDDTQERKRAALDALAQMGVAK